MPNTLQDGGTCVVWWRHIDVGAGAGGAPLDRVDLLLVSLEVVHAVVSVHCPHFQCHVIAARCQKFALRVPFDGIHLIRVTLFTKYV